MARAKISTIILVCAGFTLAGCVEGQGPFAAKTTPEGGADVARSATSVRLIDRDVEAPQVFQVTDQALWDGRPSLGGVWVASPDAVDPERVILRNEANGKFVIGALFRRERLNPGPTLQISSDAAAALGILAGQPTRLNVTALRREEAAAEPTDEAAKPILDAAETVETETLTASADAAIARAATIAPSATAPAPAPTAEPAAEIETAAAEPAVEPPKKKWSLFGRAKPKAPAGAVAVAEAAAALPADPVVASVLPAAAAPVARAAAPVAAPAAKPAATASRSVIQIGIFSVEGNAGRAKAMLAKSGVTARVLTEQSQGKTFWRVVADAAPDRTATLAKVKSAGFGDAYFVTR